MPLTTHYEIAKLDKLYRAAQCKGAGSYAKSSRPQENKP